ncbi:MAG: GNAT family N-acetyltransferase [Bdellovibrionales bacterium]|nr:GNAT family N-acetyltransferase [Bdellovibrionales bacterium]
MVVQTILNFRKVTRDSHQEVQDILDSAPTYYLKVEGVPKINGAAIKIFEDLPPNGTLDKKFVYIIEYNHLSIGIAEFNVGYPNDFTAFIGLFLLDEKMQGKGIGRKSYEALETLIKKQFCVNVIELAVNDTNDIGMKFWTNLGFERNGRSRENQGLLVTSHVYVLAKNI